MGYPRERDRLQLWTRAAGMCSHPDCKRRLVVAATGQDEAASIGQVAHIVAHKEAGPRGGVAERTPDALDRYANLILLCANHHAIVDGQERTYTVETLRTWKAEHEDWVESVTAPGPRLTRWTAIVQQEDPVIDVTQLEEAMGPGHKLASTVELRHRPGLEGWQEAAAWERRKVSAAVASTPPQHRRFAVFSLGRIPLAVQLGFVMSDRVRAALFHYDRDRAAWSWAEGEAEPVSWRASECPEGPQDEATVRVSLSAEVMPEPDLRCGFEIDIRVPAPSVRWLQAERQLVDLSRVYGDVLTAVRTRRCRRIHLFYAGPAAGAVAFGRAYNPRMNPELVVYEYQRKACPRYEPAVVLNS